MCNASCIIFGVDSLKQKEIRGKRVIEVGSYDVNGSLRSIVQDLKPKEYVGIDIVEGPGVDVVCPVEELEQKFGKNSFDAIISTCALEHIRDWQKAISNIKNICKPGGIMLIIVPSVWDYHAFPYDFWRYTKEDINNIFADCEVMVLQEDSATPSLVYAKFKKPQSFKEKDLSDYRLYSVIGRRRIAKVNDNKLRNFLIIYKFRESLKGFLKRLAGLK